MPRTTGAGDLSQKEVGVIEAGLLNNIPTSKIQHDLFVTCRTWRSSHVISHVRIAFWNNEDTESRREERCGRHRVTSPKTDERIRELAEANPWASPKEISIRLREKPYEIDVHERTVSRRINEFGLHRRKAVTKPWMSEKNREARLLFAHIHRNWRESMWKRVAFSDESHFQQHHNGRAWVWRRKGERCNPKYLKPSFKKGHKVNVFGAFTWYGPIDLIRMDGIVESDYLKATIFYNLVPKLREQYGCDKFILRHDNASVFVGGRCGSLMKRLVDRGEFLLMDFPEQSPDLNPIENLWHLLNLKAKDRRPKNADELFELLNREWKALNIVTVLCHYIRSMKRRCEAVIAADGGPTNY